MKFGCFFFFAPQWTAAEGQHTLQALCFSSPLPLEEMQWVVLNLGWFHLGNVAKISQGDRELHDTGFTRYFCVVFLILEVLCLFGRYSRDDGCSQISVQAVKHSQTQVCHPLCCDHTCHRILIAMNCDFFHQALKYSLLFFSFPINFMFLVEEGGHIPKLHTKSCSYAFGENQLLKFFYQINSISSYFSYSWTASILIIIKICTDNYIRHCPSLRLDPAALRAP